MRRRLLLPATALLLAGCAADYVPNGAAPASGPGYEAEVALCREQAHQKLDAERTLAGAAGGLLLGAAHGALAGALSGAAGQGAWIGAAAGLVVGAAVGAVAEDQDFTYAVDTCMSERGYRRS
jgi:hypothetical protein